MNDKMDNVGKSLLFCYQVISTVILPFLYIYILIRILKGKESKTRFLERFAITSHPVLTNCKLIWIHAVSVGESNSAWILIEEFLRFSPDIKIIITSTSLTSSQTIQEKIDSVELFKDRIIHQFFPADSYFIVKKFLEYWQPRAAIFIESEIWPNFIHYAYKKEIPCFLVNGRLSDDSTEKWLNLRRMGFNIFDYFSIVYSQSYIEKNNLQTLTTNIVLFEGNLKTQNVQIEIDYEELEKLKQQIGNRKTWLCSSTHEGEEMVIIDTHLKLKKFFPDLLTIIVLRHPQRAKEVINLIDTEIYKCAVRSQQPIESDTEFYIVDTFGELGTFYSLTNFVFLGGSFMPIGGHNPIEAMRCNSVVISGKYYFNNLELYESIRSYAGCIIARCSEELFDWVKIFLTDYDKVKYYNTNAQTFLSNQEKTAHNIISEIARVSHLKD